MFWHDGIAPDNQPYKVLMKRGEFVDESRCEDSGDARVVPWKMYYPVIDDVPDAVGQVPIIFWSHGFGGNRDGASFLSRFLAAQGYVVFHPSHHGTDSTLWEGKKGHPWDILRKAEVPRRASLNRFYDISFAFDALKVWAQENADAGRIIDFDTAGMSGHSFGALTSQVIAGQLFPDEHDALKTIADDRFKAGILYSPVPIGHLTSEVPENVYGGMHIPLMHMTGTDDDSPIEGYGYEHRLMIYENNTKADKYLLIKNDGDHMVYNGTRGKLAANPNRELHESLIKIGALAFWDAYLKQDAAALAWLQGAAGAAYFADHANFHRSQIES